MTSREKNMKLRRVDQAGSHCSGTGWTLVSRWWGIACASLVFCINIHIYIIIVTIVPPFLVNSFYFKPQILFFFLFSPSQWEGWEWAKGCMVLNFAGLNHNSYQLLLPDRWMNERKKGQAQGASGKKKHKWQWKWYKLKHKGILHFQTTWQIYSTNYNCLAKLTYCFYCCCYPKNQKCF